MIQVLLSRDLPTASVHSARDEAPAPVRYAGNCLHVGPIGNADELTWERSELNRRQERLRGVHAPTGLVAGAAPAARESAGLSASARARAAGGGVHSGVGRRGRDEWRGRADVRLM